MTEHVRKLAMTPGEIVTRYRQAKHKPGQIKILAQLNACSKQDIIAVLKENGVEIEKPEPRSYTVWTKEEEDRLAELYEQGLSKQKIADAMGRNIKSITYKLRQVRQNTEAPKVSSIRMDALADLGPKGKVVEVREDRQPIDVKENAMKMYLDPGETSKAVATDDGEKRQQKNWTTDEERLLLELVDKGHTHQEIGEALNRSPGSIKHKLKYMRKAVLTAELEAHAQTSLTSEAFSGMLIAAMGNGLQTGAEAKLTDVMAAIGAAVLQFFSVASENNA